MNQGGNMKRKYSLFFAVPFCLLLLLSCGNQQGETSVEVSPTPSVAILQENVTDSPMPSPQATDTPIPMVEDTPTPSPTLTPSPTPHPTPTPEVAWYAPFDYIWNLTKKGLLPEVDKDWVISLFATQKEDLVVAYEENYQYDPDFDEENWRPNEIYTWWLREDTIFLLSDIKITDSDPYGERWFYIISRETFLQEADKHVWRCGVKDGEILYVVEHIGG